MSASNRYDTLVIGAGAAGRGRQARDRIDGRIFTLHGPDRAVERGEELPARNAVISVPAYPGYRARCCAPLLDSLHLFRNR